MPDGGMAPARSLRTTFSHIAAFVWRLLKSTVSKTTPDAVAEVWSRALWHCAQYCVMTPAYRAASSADDGRARAAAPAGQAPAPAASRSSRGRQRQRREYAERVIETQSPGHGWRHVRVSPQGPAITRTGHL
jgi:hypothetical protein